MASPSELLGSLESEFPFPSFSLLLPPFPSASPSSFLLDSPWLLFWSWFWLFSCSSWFSSPGFGSSSPVGSCSPSLPGSFSPLGSFLFGSFIFSRSSFACSPAFSFSFSWSRASPTSFFASSVASLMSSFASSEASVSSLPSSNPWRSAAAISRKRSASFWRESRRSSPSGILESAKARSISLAISSSLLAKVLPLSFAKLS